MNHTTNYKRHVCSSINYISSLILNIEFSSSTPSRYPAIYYCNFSFRYSYNLLCEYIRLRDIENGKEFNLKVRLVISNWIVIYLSVIIIIGGRLLLDMMPTEVSCLFILKFICDFCYKRMQSTIKKNKMGRKERRKERIEKEDKSNCCKTKV